MDDLLCQGRGMGPAKGDAEKGVGVGRGPNPNTTDVGSRQADAPEAVGQVNGGNAGGAGVEVVETEDGTDVEQGG